MDKIIKRILGELGDHELIDRLLALPKSDLNSLLLKLFEMQTGNITPRELLKAYAMNRFAVPSDRSPLEYHRMEHRLLALAEELEIKGILLSPAAPIASCSAFGYVAQNNVISALRGTEIVSDPTNMLAVIIADSLKRHDADNQNPLYYCTTSRVLRAQSFPNRPGYSSHFGLFCIVSSGKDKGSYSCEKEMLIRHIEYYKQLFLDESYAKLSIVLRKRNGYTDNDGFFNKMCEVIKIELPDVTLSFDFEDENNGYYRGINFKLYLEKDSSVFEIGDGGFVDWIQSMTGNAKERCLISCAAIDRLMLL